MLCLLLAKQFAFHENIKAQAVTFTDVYLSLEGVFHVGCVNQYFYLLQSASRQTPGVIPSAVKTQQRKPVGHL